MALAPFHALVPQRDHPFVAVLDQVGAGPDNIYTTIDDIDTRDGVLVVVHDPPSMDAIEILDTLEESLPPVVVSVDDTAAIAGQLIAAGADQFVPAGGTDTDRLRRIEQSIRAAARSNGFIQEVDSETEQQLKDRAMDAAPIGITIADATQPDTPLVYVNDAFEAVTGFSRTQSIGRNCRFLQGPETDRSAIQELRTAIREGEPVTTVLKNYRADGTPFWNEVHLAPVDGPSTPTHFVGYQVDVTARKEAQLERDRERATLERLIDRINGLLRRGTDRLVEAQSNSELDASLTETIASVEGVVGTAIFHRDLASEVIRCRHAAGTWDERAFDPIDQEREDHPLNRIFNGADTIHRSEGDIAGDLPEELLDGLVAVLWIPIASETKRHGVLAIGANATSALAPRERTVFEALCRTAAAVFDAIQRRRLLTGAPSVDITLEVADESLPELQLAASVGRMLFEGAVATESGPIQLFFSIETSPDQFETKACDIDGIETPRIITDRDGQTVVSFSVNDTSLVSTITGHGGTLKDCLLTEEMAVITVALASKSDTRAFIETLEERHGPVSIRSLQEREGPPEAQTDFRNRVIESLTDRQHRALYLAVAGGYYAHRRSVTGEDLAETMDISTPTFHQHLRAAEEKVMHALFA